jgi:hypothetical protein
MVMGLLDRLSGRPPEAPPSVPTVIEVAKVTPASGALREVPFKAAVEALLVKPPSWLEEEEWQQSGPPPPKTPVQACSRYHSHLVANVHLHPVIAATHLAFTDHRPLVFSPDILWLLVLQGFANHVNANAAELRPQLVKHSGDVVIAVRRDDFIKGSPENPWPEVFCEFTDQLREHLGEATHELLLPSFSTTDADERAAAQLVLLDAMQSFFSWQFQTTCGIPQIVLDGTSDDWEKLTERAMDLGRFGLEWWTGALKLILDEFSAAVRGEVNLPFWRSIYKVHEGSGGSYTNGWISAFFPYLKHWPTGLASKKNRWLSRGGEELQELLYSPAHNDPSCFVHGPTTDEFPGGLARAPFLWKYFDQSYDMEFLGGFMGVRQDADTRLRPEMGWAVRGR